MSKPPSDTGNADEHCDKKRCLKNVDFSSIVTIFVGPEKKKYLVHEKLLVSQSAFFRAALDSHWVEAEDRCVTLPEEDPQRFDIFARWLYFSHLPIEDLLENRVLDCTYLIDTYLLGDMIQAPQFKNAVVSAYKACCDDKQVSGSWQAVTRLCNATAPGDLMRKLIMDIHAWEGTQSILGADNDNGKVPQDYLFDLSKLLMTMRDGRRKVETPPYNVDLCAYHEHNKDHPRCSKKP